ncbi:phospholipase/carboxylesterase [Raineyella antarctica]|uniref:Phospholipase/carboxylesterase n=1 Tax=Raineyella antarctica TaxID=1577474 RepID=A0A1G6GFC1_9ACTN|nr:dienelactone hydrolase family protein [Raineyella antarctica]SDB80599.1 phospholipase/carboxylesterase [Raineyella antarctica]
MSQITAAHWSRPEDERAGTTLVVALHGRGSDERPMLKLGRLMPDSVTLVAPRGPIPVGSGWTWFDNKGIGRPREESIKETAAALLAWLGEVAEAHSRIVLLGFSGGTAMAGGLLFTDPERFAGAVLLSGTLPWDAGFETPEGLLSGMPIFWSIDPEDRVIPTDLATRSHDWLVAQSGADLTEHVYPGVGHEISQQEAQDIAAFVGAIAAV